MPTTIQISDHVKENLSKMKMFSRETYNEIIERMMEDNLELSEKTKKEIEEAKKRIMAGEYVTQEDIEKRFL